MKNLSSLPKSSLLRVTRSGQLGAHLSTPHSTVEIAVALISRELKKGLDVQLDSGAVAEYCPKGTTVLRRAAAEEEG